MTNDQHTQARQHIRQSPLYQRMEHIQQWLDHYYLDAVAGLLPWGIGDFGTALFSILYIWFAAVKVKSLPLVLAIINNTLRDIMLGLIPFYIGDIIDVFHRANTQNMALIRGFVDGDEAVIRTVNKKARTTVLLILLSILIIAILIGIAIEITSRLLHFLS